MCPLPFLILTQARLFKVANGWEMRAIKPIPRDTQVYNTYGNLPNADLLRRYGYVISDSKDDLVEISAELIVSVVGRDTTETKRRIDILDEEEVYEEYSPVRTTLNARAYEIPWSGKIPEEMYVFCLSMMAETLDAESVPEMKKSAELKAVVLEILRKRMDEYETSMEDDERLLSSEIGMRERMAIEVRLGEKRILHRAMDKIHAWSLEPPSK